MNILTRFLKSSKAKLIPILGLVLAGFAFAQMLAPRGNSVLVKLPGLEGISAMPLSSVGRSVGWFKNSESDDYRLRVASSIAGNVKVDLYSPEINMKDYGNIRNPKLYYGDEKYGKSGKVSTKFTLKDPVGKVLKTATYGEGSEHRFVSFFSGKLAPGLYPLPVSTSGAGKNAFGIRTNQGVTLEASQFTVVTRGQYDKFQLAATLLIGKQAVGKTLKILNFDGDGKNEMQLYLEKPDRNAHILTVSGDAKWATDTFVVTSEMVGEWKILAKILRTTKQYSNSFILKLQLNGKPFYAQVPTVEEGFINIQAVANLCGLESAIPQSTFEINGKTYSTSTKIRVPVGVYTVTPKPISGAKVSPITLTVETDKTTQGLLVYNVQQELSLQADNLKPKLFDVVKVNATATTSFPYDVKTKISVELPSQLRTTFHLEAEGKISNGQPFSLVIPVRVSSSGKALVQSSLSGCDISKSLEINVEEPKVPNIDLAVEKSVVKNTVPLGQDVDFEIKVSNKGPDASAEVIVRDELPAGVQFVSSNLPTEVRPPFLGWNIGSLAVGESKIITIKTKSVKSGTFVNKVEVLGREAEPLQTNNMAQASFVVVEPMVDLSVLKSVDINQGEVGQSFVFTITAINNGPSAEANVVLSDSLPVSLEFVFATGNPVVSGKEIIWKVGRLEAGQSKQFEVSAKGTSVGAFDNIAIISGDTTEQNLENNRAKVSVVLIKSKAVVPGAQRETQVFLSGTLGSVPKQGFVILSDVIPEGSTIIPGSSLRVTSKIDNLKELGKNPQWIPSVQQWVAEPLPEPIISDGRAYWIIPRNDDDEYALTYTLAHSEPLQVTGEKVGIIIGLPQSFSGEGSRAANVAQNSVVGKALGLGELRLVQGDPSVLDKLLQVTPEELPLSLQSKVETGGAAVSLKIIPIRLESDGASNPALLIQAFDKDGKPANDRYVTVVVSPEPISKDAAPEISGFQVRLINGQGVVPMGSLASSYLGEVASTVVEAEARITGSNPAISSTTTFQLNDFGQAQDQPQVFTIAQAKRAWFIVGSASVQAVIPSFAITASESFFARGPIGDATLTTASNSRYRYQDDFKGWDPINLRADTGTQGRFPLTGDGSRSGTDVNSADGFFAKLEQGDDFLLYGQLNPSFKGLLSNFGPEVNGIQAVVRDKDSSVSAFVTANPNADRSEYFIGDVTGFYWLQGVNSTLEAPSPSNEAPDVLAKIAAGSVQASISKYDKNNPSILLSKKDLLLGSDYQIDLASGRVRLFSSLSELDANGNPQYLRVDYKILGTGNGDWFSGKYRFGVQASTSLNPFTVGATYLQFDPNQPALMAVNLGFRSNGWQLNAEVGKTGSADGSAAISSQLSYSSGDFQLEAKYQDKGLNYVEPSSSLLTGANSSKDLSFGLTYRIAADLMLDANLSRNYKYATDATVQKFGVRLAKEFGFGRGSLGYLNEQSETPNQWLTGDLSASIEPFTFSVGQKLSLVGGESETSFTVDYAISNDFGVLYKQSIFYGGSNNGLRGVGSFGVRGNFKNGDILNTLVGNENETPEAFGTTQVSATYDLPSADGSTGRARVGLSTNIPINKEWGISASAETILLGMDRGNFGLNLGATYAGEKSQFGIGAQFSLTQAGLKHIYTAGGVLQLSDRYIISPAFEASFLPDGKSGAKFSVANAFRGDDWTVLSNNGVSLGNAYTTDGPQLEGEVRTAYESDERWFWRGGVAYRYNAGLLIVQLSTGATYYITDEFGIEGNLGYVFNPPLPNSSLIFGLGANYRFAPGWVIAAGYNGAIEFGGPVVYVDQRPGFYVRLDWKFDENTFGLGQ